MQPAEDVQAEVPTQDIGSLVDAPVEQQPHSVPEALPSAPDAVPQPAADAMPFEPAQPDVLSPSQGKGALSRSHRVEQTSYAVQMRRSLQLAPLKSPRPSLYLTTRQMSSFHSQE